MKYMNKNVFFLDLCTFKTGELFWKDCLSENMKEPFESAENINKILLQT